MRLRERGHGWTDSQMIISLMLLNLAGGESVSDLDLLEKDRGLCRMLRERDLWYASRDGRWRRDGDPSSERAVGVCGVPVSETMTILALGGDLGKLTEHSYLLQWSYEGSAQGDQPTWCVKGGVIMDRRGGGERPGVALQNWTTRRLL